MSPYYRSLRQALGGRLLLIPAVAAVIRNDAGELLLQQKHDGSWSLPAGAIEPGETPETAVAREVREETGFVCTASRLIGVFGGESFRHMYSNGDEVEYTVALFHCEAWQEGAPTDPGETRQIGWFSRDTLPELVLPYDPALLFGR